MSEHPGAWWFATAADEEEGGRFDLPPPEGTCYLADDLAAALGEKLLRRPSRLVPEPRLRELRHVRVRVRRAPPLADLTSPRATGWGINAEIHTTVDYARPRAWAARLRAWGAKGLRYAVRSDPAVAGRAVALFGGAGLHARAPAGLHTEEGPLDVAVARRLLAARGVRVVPIPRDVPTVRPPKR